jgi:hypothetical protein
MGVPEVWRYGGTKLTVHQRTFGGEYVGAERSRSFPLLPLGSRH